MEAGAEWSRGWVCSLLPERTLHTGGRGVWHVSASLDMPEPREVSQPQASPPTPGLLHTGPGAGQQGRHPPVSCQGPREP